MIGLAEIGDLCELAVWSAALAGERNPVSVLLVAVPESGKSQVIRSFEGQPWCQVVTDITAAGLVRRVITPLSAMSQTGPVPRMLLVPDFTTVLSRSPHAVSSATAMLAAFIEEGVSNVYTPAAEIPFDRPITGGVLTSCPPDAVLDRRRSWVRSGFSSRFLIASYSYSRETSAAIRASIIGPGQAELHTTRIMPGKPESVMFDPRLVAKLDGCAQGYIRAHGLDFEGYGFRALTHLRRLTLAAALRAGRDYVTAGDVERVHSLVSYYGNTACRATRA